MVTSYTPTVKLAKQGSGENANTWGTILNQNVIEMVDNAFSGNRDYRNSNIYFNC